MNSPDVDAIVRRMSPDELFAWLAIGGAVPRGTPALFAAQARRGAIARYPADPRPDGPPIPLPAARPHVAAAAAAGHRAVG